MADQLTPGEEGMWIAIGLSNQLKEMTHEMFDAAIEGKHVSVVIDGEVVKTFHGRALLPDMCQQCSEELDRGSM